MATKDPAVLRQKLVDDPNTAKIAEQLKMPYEEYITLVLHYAITGEQPQFFIVKDEDLKKMGHEVPDKAAMEKYVVDTVATAAAHHGTAFQNNQKKPVSLGEAPKSTSPKADAALKAQLDAELRSKQNRKT
jgi:hypothetical protein